VRTAPLEGLERGSKTSLQIATEPYFIGLFGEEGAEKAAEFTETHLYKKGGYLWLPDLQSNEPVAIIASLNQNSNCAYLEMNGYDPSGGNGYALGVI
jgi:hypothetical protein